MTHRERTTAWHALAAPEAARRLRTDLDDGLAKAEVEVRRSAVGPNALPSPPRRSVVVQLLGQFADPLVGALLVAAVISVGVGLVDGQGEGPGRFTDTIAILLIVTLNAALGFLQERRAESALEALRDLAAPLARVIRGGEVHTVRADRLVPGDVVELDAGDAVPADLRLVEAAELVTEEGSLTGESLPVRKNATAESDADAPLAERPTMVHLGTTVTRGWARAVVVETGPRTELGRIGELLRRTERTATPLELRLARLGRIILGLCLAISALLLALGLLQGHRSLALLLLTAVSLAVAAIPEGLPAITTITLALAMQRMAERGAIVRKLPAVETLGSATVICSDKTGTLTQNRMTVRVLATAGARYDVTGHGYEELGHLELDGEPLERLPPPVEEALRVGALCNSAAFEDTPEGRRVVGDPTEAALLTLAAKLGLARSTLLASGTVLEMLPFDSGRRRMAVRVRGPDGAVTSYVKGSPDVLLPRCTHALDAQGEPRALDDEARSRERERAEGMAGEALRVLALASRPVADGDPLEEGLTLAGFVGMLDPPRPEAKDAVRACHGAGIEVRMITGDHRQTAVAIATELGIWQPGDGSMTGAEIEATPKGELPERIADVTVFARVTAEQKLRLVRALQQRGHVVAMTGDGVNDAPALREAQIGVAMGRMGTDVARDAAEMVLADDDFRAIVEAVREGRAIFRNIQKFVFFLNSANAGLVTAVIVGSFFSWMPQLTPLQLLWVNLVTNGLPALALGIDPPAPGQMQEAPRPPDSGIVGWRDLWGVLVTGAVMGASALSLFWLPELVPGLIGGETRPEQLLRARAMAFTLLAVSPLFHAFNCRSWLRSVVGGLFDNRALWAAVGISLAVHLVTILLPPLHPIFGTHALTGPEWGVVIALAALPIPVFEAWKALGRPPASRPVEAGR